VRKRELEAGLQELPDVWSTDVLGLLDLDDTKNVDRPETGAVSGSHVLVDGLHRSRAGEFPEFLVHVVRARARIISEPDTKVLDLERFLLVDNIDTDDFTAGFLNFFQLSEEVPES